MRTVTWLLNSLLQVGLLTLVVLFQPEIRRALERMGQTDQWAAKLFNVKGRYNDPSLKGPGAAPSLPSAMRQSAFRDQDRCLIVLERHTNLSEIVRTGTPVNSAVNLEVLGTIFYEGTPLHDGAPSLRTAASRPRAACCRFPTIWIWQGYGHPPPRLPGHCRKLGCHRHRGQRGDGHHLHGKNGVLIRHFDRQTLYTRLIDEMIPKETTSEKTTASSWKTRKQLLNWVSQKEDEQQ